MRRVFTIVVAIGILALMLGQGLSEAQRARAQYDTAQQILLGQSGVINPDQPVESLLSVSYILQQYGLDKDYEKEFCIAQDFLQLIQGGLDAAAARLEDSITNALNNMVSDILTKYTYCKLAGVQQICVLGNCFDNPLPECNIPVEANFSEIAKESLKQSAKQSYIAQCVVDSSLKDLTDRIDKMIQQMGPDGGPAVATDWLDTLNKAPYRMAQRRLWTMLVYTPICPYFKDAVLDYYDVPENYRTDPPDIDPNELSVDGDTPFELRAACTLPEDFNPAAIATADSFIANGGFDLLGLVSEQQNYPAGFISLADAEFEKQVAALSEVRQYQLVAGGGFLGAYQSCVTGPNGDKDCVADGSLVQAPGALQNIYTDSIKTQTDSLVQQANAGKQIMDDIGARIAVRMLSFASQPIPLRFSLSPWDDDRVTQTPTPIPTPAPVPGSGDIDDPACTGGNPECICITNDASFKGAILPIVATAIANTIAQHPEFFSPAGSNQIAAGVSYRTVLDTLCSSGSNCKTSPFYDDRIVILGSTTISVDVITPAGALRTDGGGLIAACPAGIQD
ncbi:MAG TPA: hypothetical protein VJ553_01675 [Candidatus Paceibacterota bacterium]|nr:hypothetical protein [Candidatus Paceibacterota bacterium]